MKIRNGFVSNSSSSSFVVMKSNLTPSQIEVCKDFHEQCKSYYPDRADDIDGWIVSEDDYSFRFYTVMDNFSATEFITKIGVQSCHIEDYDRD